MSGSVSSLLEQGDWVFGKRHGFGHYYYLDGGKYEGEVGGSCTSAPYTGTASPCSSAPCRVVCSYRWCSHRAVSGTVYRHRVARTLKSVCCNDFPWRLSWQWVDDKIHGKGKSRYANGNVYEGEVSSQVSSHVAVLAVWCNRLDGRPWIDCDCVLCFCGVWQWDNGRISGFGTLIYTDGDR